VITDSVAPVTLHAWAICLRAGEEARRRGDRRAGTDHLLLALFDDPTVEHVLGVNLAQARDAVELLDDQALNAVGLESGTDVPLIPMRAVPSKPSLRDVASKDRIRITPAAKRVLERATKSNRRRLEVTSQQVLAQILTLKPPDHAAVLLDVLGVNRSDVRRRLDLPGARVEPHHEVAAPFTGQSRGGRQTSKPSG